MNRLLTAALFAVAATIMIAQSACAQDKAADVTDMQLLREAVRADKRAFVESTMNLSDAEAKRFWPIYNTYQRSIDATSRRRVVAVKALLFRDQPMTNLSAKSYATEMLAVDEAEIKARRTMRNRVMRALPAFEGRALHATGGKDTRGAGLRHRGGGAARAIAG